MGVDENKAVIRRFYEEVWGKGDPDVSAEVFHDDYVRHDLRAGAAEPGAAGQTKIALDFRRAITDLDWHVDLILGDGEYVVGRWWEQLLHNQTALRLKGRLLFVPGVMVTSVPYQLRSAAAIRERQFKQSFEDLHSSDF